MAPTLTPTRSSSAVAFTVLGLLQGAASFGLEATLTYDFRGSHYSLAPKPQWSTADISIVDVAAAGAGVCETQGFDQTESALHLRDGEGIYIPRISSIINDGAPFTFVIDFKWSNVGFGGWMRILNTQQGSDIGFYGYGAGSCYRLAPYPFSHGACIPRNRYLRLVYRQEGGFIDIHVYDDNNNRAGQRWDIRSRRTAFSTFNDQLLFFNDQQHNRCYDGGEHAEAYVRTLQVFNRRLTDVELMTVMRNRAAEYVTTVTSSTATQTTQTFTTNTFGPHNNRLIQEHDADITNNTGLIEAQISTTNAMESRMVSAESRMVVAEAEVSELRAMLTGLAAPSDEDTSDHDHTEHEPCAGVQTDEAGNPKILTEDGSVEVIACGGDINFHSQTCDFNPCEVQHKLNEIDAKLTALGPPQ